MASGKPELNPTRFGFFLLNNFTLMSMTSAVEPLRLANRYVRGTHFEWKLFSLDGQPVTASNGAAMAVDSTLRDIDTIRQLDLMIICGGEGISEHVTEGTIKELRALSTTGIALGAVCTGSNTLATAGLLDNYHCSVHWENIAALTDQFRDVHVTRSIYTVDRDRYTCSGGTAPIDMMLSIIRKQLGPDVSAYVAEQLVYGYVRQADEDQRIPLRHVIGGQSEKLVTAVELMEANIREPIDQGELAGYVGLSRRQLQRLFDQHLQCTPSRYYLQIRLARARELLCQTGMGLVEISSLTGFVSTSHFSKSYKERYGCPPSSERRISTNTSRRTI
ncbi:MAG: GlxA family transcriptional regulator [Woeseiaceae bacterium]|nr:GlxA family transcriptional regulator [Woeseiaceae bacterium]